MRSQGFPNSIRYIRSILKSVYPNYKKSNLPKDLIEFTLWFLCDVRVDYSDDKPSKNQIKLLWFGLINPRHNIPCVPRCNQIISITTYFNGKLHGTMKYWYDIKQNLTSNIKNTNPTNPTNPTTHPQLRYEPSYSHGVSHGVCKSWFENGQISAIYNYVKGHLHGYVKKWNKTGTLIAHYSYVHGSMVRSYI